MARRPGAVVVALRPFALCAAGAAVTAAIVGQLQPDPWNLLTTLGTWVVIVGIVGAALALSHRRLGNRRLVGDLVVTAASVLGVLIFAVALSGTPVLPFNGDLTFRMAAATRFANTWHFVDYTYRGLPAAYPPLLPWLAGRTAGLLHIPGWQALRVVSFATLALLPPLTYTLWRQLLPVLPAAFVGASSVLVFVAYQPEEWLAAAIFVPWLLLVLDTKSPRLLSRRVVVLGIIGALLVPLYYFYLLVGIFIVPLAVVIARRTGGRVQVSAGLRVLAIAVVLSAWYWWPLLHSYLTSNHLSAGQTSYLKSQSALYLSPPLGLSVFGVLDWIGLAFLVIGFRSDRIARYLTAVVLGSYLWVLLGWITSITVHNTLVYWRAAHLVSIAALVAGVMGVTRLIDLLTGSGWRHELRRFAPVGIALASVALVIGAASALHTNSWVIQAHDVVLPDGSYPHFPHGVAAAHRLTSLPSNLVSDRQLWEALGPGADRKVVLSTRSSVEWYYPVYLFNGPTPSYAHTAAGYVQRADFLERLARLQDPFQFYQRTQHNRFQRIDAVILYRRPNGRLYYSSRIDVFGSGTRRKLIPFSMRQFDPAFWRISEVGPYFVALPLRG